MLLQEGLSAHGLKVDCASNFDEARQLAAHAQYDVLLCDVNSSKGGSLSGRETALSLFPAGPRRQPALIFMSGDLVDQGDGRLGASHRLQKPFRISDVLAAIEAVLPVSKVGD